MATAPSQHHRTRDRLLLRASAAPTGRRPHHRLRDIHHPARGAATWNTVRPQRWRPHTPESGIVPQRHLVPRFPRRHRAPVRHNVSVTTAVLQSDFRPPHSHGIVHRPQGQADNAPSAGTCLTARSHIGQHRAAHEETHTGPRYRAQQNQYQQGTTSSSRSRSRSSRPSVRCMVPGGVENGDEAVGGVPKRSIAVLPPLAMMLALCATTWGAVMQIRTRWRSRLNLVEHVVRPAFAGRASSP